MNVMKIVTGLFFSGFVGCLLLSLVMAVVAIAVPWMYGEVGYYWYTLAPMMWCSWNDYGGTTTGGCDDEDYFCDTFGDDDPYCEVLKDGQVAMAMYLIGCVAGCVGGIMALVDLCKNKRPIRIVAYICLGAMFILYIIATAVFFSACDTFCEEDPIVDEVMDYTTGSSCGIVSIVMLVPAVALYILFVVFRMKFGDN